MVFAFLERELLSTKDFVEFSQQNRHTHSSKFRSIILLACGEIEIPLRRLCIYLTGNEAKSQSDITNLIDIIDSQIKFWEETSNRELHLVSVWPATIRPLQNKIADLPEKAFSEPCPSKIPFYWPWWGSYTDAKHQNRTPKNIESIDHYTDSSTLQHAIDAVGALFILLLQESAEIEKFNMS